MKNSVLLCLVLFVGTGILLAWLDIGISVTVTKVEKTPSSEGRKSQPRAQGDTTTLVRKREDSSSAKASLSGGQRRIVYVHVGKCGGAALKNNFPSMCGIRDAERKERCDQRQQKQPESALSKQLSGYIHKTQIAPNPDVISDATSFLLLIRNPVTRVVSWFAFQNPINCVPENQGSPSCSSQNHKFTKQLFDCFPDSMEKFAQSLAPESSSECATLAKQAMKLEGSSLGHLEKNYKFYYEAIGGLSKEIFVVRTEHLWDDVKEVNRLVSMGEDDDDAFAEPKEFHHGILHKVNRTLSQEGTKHLCCYLVEEIRIYNQMLEAAVNLDEAETAASKDAVIIETCGLPSMEALEYECRMYD